jgi:hypothetical protein
VKKFWLLLIILYYGLSAKTVRIEYVPKPGQKKVMISADFTGWKQVAMKYDSSKGQFFYEVDLKPGIYEYRFFANQRFFRDPKNLLFGGKNSNSLIYIPGTEPVIEKILPPIGSTIYSADFNLKVKVKSPVELNVKKSVAIVDNDTFHVASFQDGEIIFHITNRHTSLPVIQLHIFNTSNEKAFFQPFAYRIKLQNHPPVAEAGYLYKAIASESFRISGLHSTDPDMDPIIKFKWELLTESEDLRFLSSDTISEPKLIARNPGIYSLRLKVFDGTEWSNWDTTFVWVIRDYRVPIRFEFTKSDFKGISVTSLALVGEFNRWKAGIERFQKRNHTWVYNRKFFPGIYEYKLVVNDSLWMPDPRNLKRIEDGWQGYNSILELKNPDNFMPLQFRTGSGFILPISRHHGLQSYQFKWIVDPNSDLLLRISKKNDTLFISTPAAKGQALFYIQVLMDSVYSPVYSFLYQKNNGVEKVYSIDQSPAWIYKTILYEIFVPAFGKNFNRDNLRDITSHFSYFQQLGINSLWLTPIYPAPTDHHYNPTAFTRIDSKLGSMDVYKTLIHLAHQNQMTIFFDFVANHSGDQHPYFISAWKNPDSYFRNFYRFHGPSAYEYHNDWDQLPNLNYSSTIVRQFMTKVAEFWVNSGVDAFRCDAAWGVPHSYWKYLRKYIKSINPEFVLLNEVLPRDPSFHRDEFDMSYNTDLYGNILDFLRRKKSWKPILLNFKKDTTNFPAGSTFMNYLENHDMPRFISEFDEKKTLFFTAFILLAPGTPMIYYGQEAGLGEQRAKFDPSDPEHLSYFKFINRLIRLRKKILKSGVLKPLEFPDLLSFGNSKYKIYLNPGEKPVLLNKKDSKIKKFNRIYKINSIQMKPLSTSIKKIWIKPFEMIVIEK